MRGGTGCHVPVSSARLTESVLRGTSAASVHPALCVVGTNLLAMLAIGRLKIFSSLPPLSPLSSCLCERG